MRIVRVFIREVERNCPKLPCGETQRSGTENYAQDRDTKHETPCSLEPAPFRWPLVLGEESHETREPFCSNHLNRNSYIMFPRPEPENPSPKPWTLNPRPDPKPPNPAFMPTWPIVASSFKTSPSASTRPQFVLYISYLGRAYWENLRLLHGP